LIFLLLQINVSFVDSYRPPKVLIRGDNYPDTGGY
jgi:hypothetical protein